MNFLKGLVGAFLVLGSVGGLEQDSMSIVECLFYSTIGFVLIWSVVKEIVK
jgi:hypothetical protein